MGPRLTLERVVRVIRATRPEVVITMNPSPSPGNHGNHQYAARLAIEAYTAAADPRRSPSRSRARASRRGGCKRLYRTGVNGTGRPGPHCAESLVKGDPTDTVGAAWPGPSQRVPGKTWSQLAARGRRLLHIAGLGQRAARPPNPDCLCFTQIASRVPFSPTAAATDVFEGARLPAAGGLPLGTELYLTSESFDLAAGKPVRVTAHVRWPSVPPARGARDVGAAGGWTVPATGGCSVGVGESTATFTVTPAAPAAAWPLRAGGHAAARPCQRLHASGGPRRAGRNRARRAPAAGRRLRSLGALTTPRSWRARQAGTVARQRRVPHGPRRPDQPERGAAVRRRVADLPAGFQATPATRRTRGSRPARRLGDVRRDEHRRLAADLKRGRPPATTTTTITTASGAGSSTETFGLELVPVTSVPEVATAPTVDGTEGAGEYPGPALDLSRVWEGAPCDSAADCSATAKSRAAATTSTSGAA